MIFLSLVFRRITSPAQQAISRVTASPLGYRLASGFFWSVAGAVISRGLMLLASIAVARLFGKTGYGELGMIQSTVGMFGVFAGFGLGLTATKHVAELRTSDPARAGRILSLSSVVAVVSGGLMALGLLAFAPWLATHTINAPHLANALRIGSVILFISALNGAQTGALSGFEAFKTIAQVNIIVGLLSFPVLIAGAYWGGLTGAVWALAVNLGFNWLFNHLALRKEALRYRVPLLLKGCMKEWSVLWKFSLPAVLAGSMVGPVNWACSALLVTQPGGYGEMGIYSVANQWFNLLLFLPSTLDAVVLPVLSNQLGLNNAEKSKKVLQVSIKANLLIVVPIAILASIASPFIMSLYGATFANGWPTLVIVLVTGALVALNDPLGQILAASNRMWVGFAMNTGWALAFIGSTFLLKQHGSLGLASARAIAYGVHTVWVFWFASSLLDARKRTLTTHNQEI